MARTVSRDQGAVRERTSASRAALQREPQEEVPVTSIPFPLAAALAIALAATIDLGVLPESVLRFVQRSGQELVRQERMVPLQQTKASEITAPSR